VPLGFEGGQTPLHIRVPKRGFNNKKFVVGAACPSLHYHRAMRSAVMTCAHCGRDVLLQIRACVSPAWLGACAALD